MDDNSDGVADYYQANIVSATDYYAFGMQMEGRGWPAEGKYRYGVNGHERDQEIEENGDIYTAESWEYDSRLGKRWNIDPVVRAHESPYAVFADNPILMVDLDGKFPFRIHVRSFAPFDIFGGYNWRGDGADRRFSLSPRATARLTQITTYETTTQVYTTKAIGSWSLALLSPIKLAGVTPITWKLATPYLAYTYLKNRIGGGHDLKAYSEATVTGGDGKGTELHTHLSGNDDAVLPGAEYHNWSPAADIDLHTYLSLSFTPMDNGDMKIGFKGQLRGDQFPSAEAFVEDKRGVRIFLGVGPARRGPTHGPFLTLPGDHNLFMGNINMSVISDKDGNFNGVEVNGTYYIISVWNFHFYKQNPIKEE